MKKVYNFALTRPGLLLTVLGAGISVGCLLAAVASQIESWILQ